jgi:F0F1-type ATP synthase assembly protein I
MSVMARQDTPDENAGRLKQIRLAYTMTKKVDPKIGWILAGIWVGILVVLLAVGFALGHPLYLGILGVILGLLAAVIIFGRRAEKAAFGQMDGQPGAAAAVLNNMKRGWTVTPVVAATRNQDVVHRAVGRAGVVLVGEGNVNRLRPLLSSEKRKVNRMIGDVPVTEVIVGDGKGQIPLKKLQMHLTKLPRPVAPAQVTVVNDRLRAIGDLLSNAPIPKGPMPKGGGKMR